MYGKNAVESYGRYRRQSAMTASPGELTLMLYDGCIKFLKQSQMHMEERQIAKAGETSLKAQNIITELMATLDMQYDISKQLFALYDFIQRQITQSNIKKDPAMVDMPIQMVTELRDTWAQAVKISRQTAAAQGAYADG